MLRIRACSLICITLLWIVATPNLAGHFLEAGPLPHPAETTVISISPVLASVPVGGTIQAQVQIANPNNLYAFELTMSFDPSVIQIEDMDAERSGVQIGMGSLFDGRQYFVATHHVDNDTGTIRIAVTLLGIEAPINADGNLLTMVINGRADGRSPIAITSIILSDNQANTMSAEVFDATIIVGAGPSETPGATLTPSPTDMPTVTPTASSTATPTPESTATPTATPKPQKRVNIPLLRR